MQIVAGLSIRPGSLGMQGGVKDLEQDAGRTRLGSGCHFSLVIY